MPGIARIPPVRADGLQLDENRGFQFGFWRLQRWSWLGFGLLVALAGLGLTGSGGPLSRQHIRIGEVEALLPRIARLDAVERAIFTIPARPDGPGLRSLAFDNTLRRAFAIEEISPPPQRREDGPAGTTLHFDLQPAPAGGPGLEVVLTLRPVEAGWHDVQIGDAHRRRRIGILVLP